MSRWYGDDDPFQLVAHARVIILKHNGYVNVRWNGEESCLRVTRIYHETFAVHYLCPERDSFGSSVSRSATNELISEGDIDPQFEHLFKDKPNGFYEVMGDLYMWSSRSYEGEYDYQCEMRDFKWRPITFNQAAWFDDDSVLFDETIYPFHTLKGAGRIDSEKSIHWSMPIEQIKRNHINALVVNVNQYAKYDDKISQYEKLSQADYENYVYMYSLEIDSKNDRNLDWIKEFNEEVKKIIAMHEEMMVPRE